MFSASILLAVAMLATGLPGLQRSQHAVQAASSPSWVKPYEVKLIDHPSEDKTSGLIGFNFNATLSTFGKVQGDGTFNWHDSKSYGGGFNVGTAGKDTKAIDGVGGGYSFNATNVDVGAGISAFNQKVNFQLDIAKDGTMFVYFDASTASLSCTHVGKATGSNKGITCTAKPEK